VFTIDNLPGLQTFTFDRTGITAFEVRNAYLQLDNVVLNEAISAVPELPVWALMGLGAGLAAARLGRQKKGLKV
jgi:hypothetical protein